MNRLSLNDDETCAVDARDLADRSGHPEPVWLRLAGDAVPVGCFVWDVPAARAVRVDAHARELVGAGAHEPLTADRLSALLTEADRQQLATGLREAVESGGLLRARCRLSRPGDGSVRYIEVRGVVERDAAGAPAAVIGILVDITHTVQTERRLQQSQSRFRSVFGTSLANVLVVRADGGFATFNEQSCRSLAFERTQFARLRIEALDVGGVLAGLVAAALAGGAPAPLETRLRAGDGSLRDVLVTAHAAACGGRPCAFVLWLDLSRQRDTERLLVEQQERLRLALASGRMGTWHWIPASDEAHWNEAMYMLCGLPLGRPVTGSAFVGLVLPEDRPGLRAYLKRLLQHGTDYEAEYRIRRPDGEVRWLAVKGAVLRDAQGGPATLVGVSFDVTDRQSAILKLRDADRRKDEFLAMLAHELRNPLAPIVNATRLLQRSRLDAGQRAAVELIERQSGQLTHLVNGLLEVSRLTRGQIALRKARIRLADVLAIAVEGMVPLAAARRQHIEIHGDAVAAELHADPARLAQSFANLLHNAIKFSPGGTAIGVHIEQTPHEITVRVVDHGVGIAKDALPHIFDPLIQLDVAIERSQGGLGIGLALVRQLVELHGGAVHAHSDGPGCGATLTVRLPKHL